VWGGHIVVLPRFDAEGTLAAIEQHRADVVYLVPTMMKRIWALPESVRLGYDLSSLRIAWHLAEPCPAWLKEAWIDWLGPERIYELYGGTEAQLATVITGTEWLEHRGSVGRPTSGEIMICDPEGNRLPANEQGELWLRSGRDTPTYRYVGAEARTREGGWESLGDNGWIDGDGYLYLGDRVGDMILTGGANVYPAEVEAALLEHPGVRTCAVIGLPDEDKGNRVHAIVEANPGAIDDAELRAFLAERLVTYKLPRTFEYVAEPLRDDAGKVRRGALRADRI
jgi:bile acid-coenzyme A ligase